MATFQPINPLDFLKELLTRYSKKSPKFFQILQYVLGGLSVIAGIPLGLQMLNVTLPEAFNIIANKSIFYATLLGTFLTGLPVEDVKEVVAEEPNKLPLTAKVENNKVVEEIKAQEDTNKTIDEQLEDARNK